MAKEKELIGAGKLVAAMIPKEQPPSPPGASAMKCRRCDGEAMGDAAHWPDLCPACHDVGRAALARRRIEAIPLAIARAGVPLRFRRDDLALPSVAQEAVLDESEWPRGLFLHGLPSRGKSMALALLMREWFRRWSQDPRNAYDKDLPDVWRWVDYTEFTMELQDSFKNGDGETTAHRLIKNLAQVPRLILDDIGVERPTQFIVQSTYVLIDQREKWMRPTYITTNVPLPGLDEQYGGRIVERIAHTCEMKELVGKNWRLGR